MARWLKKEIKEYYLLLQFLWIDCKKNNKKLLWDWFVWIDDSLFSGASAHSVVCVL